MNKSQLVKNIIIPLLIVLGGIVVGKAYDLLSLGQVVIGAAISILIILGIVAIVWGIGVNNREAEISALIADLKNLSPSARYHWLLTSGEINMLEAKVNCKEICVVSPDLSNDTGNPEIDITGVVKGNLDKKMNYTYFVPDTEIIDAVLPHLTRTFTGFTDQLRIIRIPQSSFQLLTSAHITIFNPYMENGEEPQVYIELPIEKRGAGRGYWIRASDNAALGFVGRFKRIVENGGTSVKQT